MTTKNDFEEAAKILYGVQLLVVVGLLGWAAVHFIRKFW